MRSYAIRKLIRWDFDEAIFVRFGNKMTSWEDFGLVDRLYSMIDVVVVDLSINLFFSYFVLPGLDSLVGDSYAQRR